MKVLFDQGTPVPLRFHLKGHAVETAFEKGWGELKNGDLLSAAESAGFDVLLTTDQNLRYQQDLSERSIKIVVLLTTNWPRIQRSIDLVQEMLESLNNQRYVEIAFPEL
jgi:hypothetical protein